MFCLISDDLGSFERKLRYFAECPSLWRDHIFFAVRLGLWVLRKTTTEVKCHPHRTTRARAINISISEDVSLDMNLSIVLTHFFHSNVAFPSSQIPFFGSQSGSAAHTQGGGGEGMGFSTFLKSLFTYVFSCKKDNSGACRDGRKAERKEKQGKKS